MEVGDGATGGGEERRKDWRDGVIFFFFVGKPGRSGGGVRTCPTRDGEKKREEKLDST